MAAIARLADAIVAASQVLIIGSGGASSMLAVELQNRLFRFRINAVAYVDGHGCSTRPWASRHERASCISARQYCAFSRSAIESASLL